jgi:hypothetical protein
MLQLALEADAWSFALVPSTSRESISPFFFQKRTAALLLGVDLEARRLKREAWIFRLTLEAWLFLTHAPNPS